MKRRIILFGLLLLALLAVFLLVRPAPPSIIQSNLIVLPVTAGDFERATSVREFEFPLDHGSHNEFQTEWWYYTGNLTATSGEQFGFQLTFFRRALLPLKERLERETSWATEQIYLAHFTLTDVENEQFHFAERFSRGASGLAGANVDPWFTVWLYDWEVNQLGENDFVLRARNNEIGISLQLADVKGPILHGDSGLSQKGPQPGNASYYISQTRLIASGAVQIGDTEYLVEGTAWMDHEFSTSALSADQIGWDWFSIQLNGDREIMAYTIRKENGDLSPYSNGTIIHPDRSTQSLGVGEFIIKSGGNWESPNSGATYPSGWTLEIPSEGIELRITPLLEDQELVVSFIYWEGAVEVEGTWGGNPVSGRGYVELTGYAGSMAGQF